MVPDVGLQNLVFLIHIENLDQGQPEVHGDVIRVVHDGTATEAMTFIPQQQMFNQLFLRGCGGVKETVVFVWKITII